MLNDTRPIAAVKGLTNSRVGWKCNSTHSNDANAAKMMWVCTNDVGTI